MRITLATLASATAQQVFDQVRDHMLRQGKRSMLHSVGPTCAYRSHDGLMCAAGCLMTDAEYAKVFERHDWPQLVARGFAPADHAYLIRSLQGIHDGYMPEQWECELRALAKEHDLAWTVTLASLPTASAQEVFEQAAKHLLKQNEQCRVGASCAYRGSAGACAAGALLSDADAALVRAEGMNTGVGWEAVVQRLGATSAHSSLITDLQVVHDTTAPTFWRDELRFLARKRHLDCSFLDLPPSGSVEPISFRETTLA